MSEQTKDGGPAFPRPPFTPKDSHDQFAQAGLAATGHPGMSLRDWFAGQALAGLLGNSESKTDSDVECSVPGAIARYCYDAADAMLERRGK